MLRGVTKSQLGHTAQQASLLPGTLLCREDVCVACEQEGQELSENPVKLPQKHGLPRPQPRAAYRIGPAIGILQLQVGLLLHSVQILVQAI